MIFAKRIVPKLSQDEFEGFRLVFEKTDEILNAMHKSD